MLSNNRGMTLIEIVIVVAILASLMAVLGSKVNERYQKAKVNQAKIQIGELTKALDMYYTDCFRYPTEGEGLEALVSEDNASCSNWGPSPYIKKAALRDPWDREFIYESDGTSFTIISLGADGKEGGSKLGADITSDD
jgi:general secretion pathway protein G